MLEKYDRALVYIIACKLSHDDAHTLVEGQVSDVWVACFNQQFNRCKDDLHNCLFAKWIIIFSTPDIK